MGSTIAILGGGQLAKMMCSAAHKLGFKTVSKDTLPEKVWSVCVKCYKFNHCDEIAVLLELK